MLPVDSRGGAVYSTLDIQHLTLSPNDPAVLRTIDQPVRGAAAAARVRDAHAAAHPVADQPVCRAGLRAGALHAGGRLFHAPGPSVLFCAADAAPQGAAAAVDHAPPDP